MEVGLRIVRGPDWKWDNQDDGEGHVGTVVEIGKLGSLSTPDKTVVVQWDSGSRTNYRVGYQGACDLRLFDNAATGVRHNNIICSFCKKHGIAGMRWKCLICSNYDMCTSCYMNGKHDLNHTFLRLETGNSSGVEIPKRSLKNTVKIQSKGIFVGAHVVRGYDWDWGNQDGGEGKVGKVIDIRGWDNESRRSVANVIWSSGSTNVYRLGHKGKVDLKYVVDAPGGYYYRDHLPVLGRNYSCDQSLNYYKKEENLRGAIASSISSGLSISASCSFNVGDKVKVVVTNEEELKLMQEGHGGWNSRMVQFIGQIGTVHRVTNKGDIRVQFENCHNRWTFNPEALTKVTFCSVGDIVKIIDDENKVRDLQKSHGEWVEQMRKALGKIGKVVQVYTDGDLRVNVDGQTWTFNSLCVIRLPGSMVEMNNTMIHNQPQREDIRNPRLGHFLFEGQAQPIESNIDKTCSSSPQMMLFQMGKDSIVREAAQGKLASVKEILEKIPEAISCESGGKTALQVACHQGHLEIVKLLLSYNAEIDSKDDEGDTALHYAVFGNQPEIIELLAKKAANLDFFNQANCTPLHIAVNKGHLECAKVLIRNGCNVNLQDNYGDTVLHDAIGKSNFKSNSNPKSTNVTESNVLVPPSPIAGSSSSSSSPPITTSFSAESLNQEIIELLINASRTDFTIKNKRGFNCLHHAALKGNSFACERLIAKSRQLVDLKKEDGFSALHLAALNGHYEVAEILIISGQANVNICNNRKQTPLHLAVSRCHCSIIKLLVSMGANCNSLDEELDTPLHLAMFKWNIIENVNSLGNNSIINDFLSQLEPIVGHKGFVNLAIGCYLIQEGNADIFFKNRDGRNALSFLETNQNENLFDVSRVKEFILNLIDDKVKGISDVSSELEKLIESANISSHVSYSFKIGEFIPIDVINDLECIICNENFADVQFEPCRHQICCNDCCFKMKRCVICKKSISRKVLFNRLNGQILNIIDNVMAVNIRKEKSGKNIQEKVLSELSPQDNTSERLKYLESKIMEIEEANSCGICLEKTKNVVFLCGHGACVNCANTLKICHMCRKTITKKISIY